MQDDLKNSIKKFCCRCFVRLVFRTRSFGCFLYFYRGKRDKMKKVVVGLSGGVDSSVAAYFLKQQGYEVHGMFMINWHDVTGTLSGACPWEEDVIIAELVAKKINIPFHRIDLSEAYRARVVEYLFDEYSKGRTPNPDVLCNREIKFDLFAVEAFKLGADYVATGHYCRKDTIAVGGKEYYRLLMGMDRNKDQSYFLCQLSQEQLRTALFPIGHLTKAEVRKWAEKLKLPTATRKDSQGICFVGKVNLPLFLQQKLERKEGNIIEIPAGWKKYARQVNDNPQGEDDLARLASPYRYHPLDGKIIGKHEGAHFFTLGQRKGLKVGGKKKPLFVIATDVHRNVVYVGEGEDHPGLFRRALYIAPSDVHWIRPDCALKPGEQCSYAVRIRYRQALQAATLYMTEKGLYVVFKEPQRSITPGQFAAWYAGEELVGSGVIA